jgi:hypothetical protein
MNEQENSCDMRIWCEECQRCDYTTVGKHYFCASCGKLLQPDPKMEHANFTIVSSDEDQPA